MKYLLIILLLSCTTRRHNPINSGALTWPVDSFKLDTNNVYIFDSNPVFNLPYIDTVPYVDTVDAIKDFLNALKPPDTTLTIYHSEKYRTFIRQEVIFSQLLNKYLLVTTDGALYDNVIYGTLEHIQLQKPIEYKKALARRKPVALIKCK